MSYESALNQLAVVTLFYSKLFTYTCFHIVLFLYCRAQKMGRLKCLSPFLEVQNKLQSTNRLLVAQQTKE